MTPSVDFARSARRSHDLNDCARLSNYVRPRALR